MDRGDGDVGVRMLRRMKYSRTDTGDETVLAIAGSLDAAAASELHDVTNRIVEEQRRSVTLELSHLEHLAEGVGVAAIVGLAKRVQGYGGEIKIVGLKGQPLAIFHLLRLEKVFSI
ncbi:Hypothetical protein A7982_02283 [Minicystis rosea]|nr:Hypothetical protein A7982_02283 [Minicystis rosea]